MMFHVEQNKKNLHCETKDYLVTGESFKVYLDQNNIIGKTHPIPQKEEMDKYYESEEYYPHSLNKKSLLAFLYTITRKHMHLKRLTWIRGYIKKNTSILDYGCGSGDFVKYLRSKSIDAYGYEPNYNFCEHDFLTNQEGWKNKKYEVIVLWHVLEHIHNPFDLIQSLKKRLNKKGKILIAIPNFKSFDSKYYGKYWAGYDTPRHLWHFSRKGLGLMAKENNFKVLKVKSLHLDSIYVSCLSEKYKRSPFPLLIGIVIGCISILKSFFTKESSSFLFVLKKT